MNTSGIDLTSRQVPHWAPGTSPEAEADEDPDDCAQLELDEYEQTSKFFDGDAWYLGAKQLADGVFSAFLLVPALPVMLISIILVKLNSRGPGLYSQVRVGENGRPFVLYKIRTMSHECERDSGPKWSTKGDHRVTRIGRFLRATHLDELPQLINILRGEMSLIGPRPERPEFVEQLKKKIPHYADRLAVRPGLTGLAQVQLPPDEDEESVRRKVACDLYYIRWSGPTLDAKILIATALKVVGLPLSVSCRALRIPTGLKVESVYRQREESTIARISTV